MASLRVLPLVARTVAEFGRMLGWLAPAAALVVLTPEALDRILRAAHVRGLQADVPVFAGWLAAWALQLTAAMARAPLAAPGQPPMSHALRTAERRVAPAGLAGVNSLAAVLAATAVLVAPGLVALAWLAVAPAAAVHEAGGPWRAVVRSLDLTRGHRGPVFAALALVIAIAAAAVAGAWAAVWASGATGEVEALAGVFALMLFSSLPAVGSAVLYEALRAAKEAPRRAELERVFG